MTRRHLDSGTPWEQIVGYSRAVRVGDLVFVAGTTGPPRCGGSVEDDAAEQARSALRRIQDALEALGATLGDVVQTRMFVTDIGTWEAVGRVHAEFFGDVRPATAMVEVSRLIDPTLLVEIEAIAVVGDAPEADAGRRPGRHRPG